MKIPPSTKKQTEILLYLYKFRFLNTYQIQKLLGHNNSNRTLTWLKDLIEKNCVKRKYDRHSFISNTKPAIYYLGPKARHILRKGEKVALEDLEYIYSEHRRDSKFITHCLHLCDVYLFLLSQKDTDEEMKFFTKNELHGYEYFPNPMPDAFIVVNGKNSVRRFFLDLFDEFTPAFVLRKRVRMYIEYTEKPDWDEHTDFTPFPSILFICPNESIKKHVLFYAKALLDKTYEDKLSFFLTTKTRIQRGEKNTIWQKVE